MSISAKLQNLLQLAPHEAQVLDALTPEAQRPSQVVRAAGVPNASAYLAFDLLCQRGLAEKRRVNGKPVWLRAAPLPLQDALSGAINELEHIKNSSVFEIKHKLDTSVTVHRGAQALKKLIFRAVDLNPHERFHILQGANLDDSWMEMVGRKNVLVINRMLKAKQIIGESFIPENYFKNLLPFWGREWAESYVDRLNVVHLIPSEFMPSHAEIILFRDRVLVIHFKEEIAVEMKDTEMLLMFKMLFEYLKTFARKVDPKEFLEQELRTYLPK